MRKGTRTMQSSNVLSVFSTRLKSPVKSPWSEKKKIAVSSYMPASRRASSTMPNMWSERAHMP